MFTFNLFKTPLENETLDAWLKILEDIAKVAILAFPVLVYGQGSIIFKVANSLLLIIVIYGCLLLARNFRQYRDQKRGD